MSQPPEQTVCVLEHVPFVDPKRYRINDLEGVNPHKFFVTSGDAVWKANYLEKQLNILLDNAKQKYGNSTTQSHIKFIVDLKTSIKKCKAFIKHLIAVRGDAIFLEVEWREHVLYIMPKNPRIKPDLGQI